MSRKANPKPEIPSPKTARAKRSLTLPLAIAGFLVIGAVAVVWQRGLLSAAPTVVEPAAPELLDPGVRGLVARSVAEVRERPRDSNRHGRLGMIYEANALWPEARDAYAQASRLEPANRAWRYHLAVSTQQAGDFATALSLYRDLAADEPGFAALQHRLGVALLEIGELEQALHAFRRVTKLVPREAAGHAGAGTVLRLLGRPTEAAERLERAIELDPANRTAHYQLGLTYRDLGRAEAAERELGLGLSATIDFLADELSSEIASYAISLPATVERAEALRQAGRHREVAALFERALATHPDNLTLLNNLASSYLVQGEPERARQVLDRALAAGGDDAETLLNLAGWALATGRPEEAIGFADRALALDDRLARLHAVKAQALITLRRYPAATASMEDALRLEVRDPALFIGLGVLYEAASRWADAAGVYERALARWPDLVPAHVGRCLAALALGDRAAAEESLAATQRLAPEHPRLNELRRSLESL